MPFTNRAGVRIHYVVEGDPEGPPVVLQHGITLSLACWRSFGYAEALGRTHRLVLVDARGHGQSGTPADPAECTTEAMAADVLAVMDACGVERAHYVGYSMGGWIGYLLAGLAPERFLSMALGGAHAEADDLSLFRDTLARGMGSWIELCEAGLGALPDELRRQFEALDVAPLREIVREDRPALPRSLEAMTMPCLLWAGDEDPRVEGARRCAERLPAARFVALEGMNHMQAFVRGEAILPALVAHLSR